MRKRKMTTLYLMTGVLVLSLLIGLLVHYQLSVEETASKEPVVQEKEPEKDDAGLPYMIQTTCDVLRIRAGAGTHHRQTGEIRETTAQKKKYTIIEEKNGWGKLKSGAGWIALAYTKRVG